MNKIGFYSVARIDDKNLSYRLDGFFFASLYLEDVYLRFLKKKIRNELEI